MVNHRVKRGISNARLRCSILFETRFSLAYYRDIVTADRVRVQIRFCETRFSLVPTERSNLSRARLTDRVLFLRFLFFFSFWNIHKWRRFNEGSMLLSARKTFAAIASRDITVKAGEVWTLLGADIFITPERRASRKSHKKFSRATARREPTVQFSRQLNLSIHFLLRRLSYPRNRAFCTRLAHKISKLRR